MFLFKRFAAIVAAVGMFAVFSSAVEIENTGTKVGGHVKIIAADGMAGTWTDTAGVEHKDNQLAGFEIHETWVIFSQEVSNFISVELMPEFSASAGATPRFGRPLNSMAVSAPAFKGWTKALVKFGLPKDWEISLGIVEPRFSVEYGSELWWEDELNGNKTVANGNLGAMHECGLEIYKSFELGKLSLPVYLYIFNGGGSEFGETNMTPLGVIHIEPEIGPVKFSGSFGFEKYDKEDSLNAIRWSAGASLDLKGFNLRGEVIGGNWEDRYASTTRVGTQYVTTYKDAKAIGFFVKTFYRYADWGKVGVDVSYAKQEMAQSSGVDKFLTITPLLIFNPVASVSIISQNDIGIWSRDATNRDNVSKDQKLNFFRSTLGVRLTF